MLSDGQKQQLAAYQLLVGRYHRTLDLMSEKGLEHLPQKIQESLSYASQLTSLFPYPDSPYILDIGSGAGLPAIIMAIACPQYQLYLVERRQKRAAFLDIVVARLGINNVRVFAKDVREVGGLEPCSAITALAVGEFSLLYELSHSLQAKPCYLLSRKSYTWSLASEPLGQVLNSLKLRAEVPLSEHAKLVVLSLT